MKGGFFFNWGYTKDSLFGRVMKIYESNAGIEGFGI
jgi:hypothetical protein